jgi:hypothetical protein
VIVFLVEETRENFGVVDDDVYGAEYFEIEREFEVLIAELSDYCLEQTLGVENVHHSSGGVCLLGWMMLVVVVKISGTFVDGNLIGVWLRGYF